MKNKNKGFTLIELLIVILIIGALATLILVATNSSRGKGADGAIKANLQAVRTQSSLFFVENNNSYLPVGGTVFAISGCPAFGASGANMFSRDKTISNALVEAYKRSGAPITQEAYCYNSSTKWAVAMPLKTGPTTTSWCVDSEGNSKKVNLDSSLAINTTTFICN